ncbi:MAG: hypothetical protein ACRD4S_12310 [Candidatus Acidiferrales bacterium]
MIIYLIQAVVYDAPKPGKSRRLPKAKPMTIAIGFRANDGVLICADMQKTVGEMKTYDGKIEEIIFHSKSRLTLAIVGSGYDDYIQTARQALTADFPADIPANDLKQELRTRLLEFWKEHLLPWPEAERPQLELLVGATGKDMAPRLFHYSGTAFSEVSAKAIGLGVLLAQDLINRYRPKTYELEQLARIAMFIVSRVKDGVEGCGGPTHLTALRKADVGYCEYDQIITLEEEFEKIQREFDEAMVERIGGDTAKVIRWMGEISKKKEL